MSVHYKFKSSLDYDTVTFDGLHISVADLKKAILQQKKIGKGFDFDLKITNAQTKEVYSDDDCLIPKNASVIVSRVPTSSTAKKGWDRNDSPSLLPAVANNDSDSVSFDKVTKSADLVSANASEDEKIKAMMSQSTLEYDPSR
ncbi:E3 ubiquitin-protein ligase rbbp6 [Chamberlinius hualienensis]